MVSSFGIIGLLGSGETSAQGGRVFEYVAQRLPQPPRVVLLETPAGFEPNSLQVAERVADFMRLRLQNYRPALKVLAARQRHTAFSPDDPALNQPILQAHLIYMGAGSPSYTVRQLQNSWVWQALTARHRAGAALVIASAASIALGAYALPVYEIYKVGEDLHWKPGLNFFAPYGLSLTIVPHWNNAEGGADLDTNRCFMGQARFAALQQLLPADATVVGIDEHTALIVDLNAGMAEVLGRGSVSVIRAGNVQICLPGERLPLQNLGPFHLPEPSAGLPPEVWAAAQFQAQPAEPTIIPPEVAALVEERQAARANKEWAKSDTLRQQIAALGWQVKDTKEGAVVTKI